MDIWKLTRADKLFVEGADRSNSAWFQNPSNKFFLYSEGYKDAGAKLYDICIDDPFHLNTLVYPLIFNYRQFIELRIKELTIMAYKYLGEDIDFADVHDLEKLWMALRNLIERIESPGKEYLDNVQRIVLEFNTEDPGSMSYRYPVTKGKIRKPSISRQTLDLKNFKSVIDKLIYFFDTTWEHWSNLQVLQDEMLADMYRNYY